MATTTTAAISKTSAPSVAWLRALVLVCRIVTGGIFVAAAFTKFHFNSGWHFGDYHFFFSMVISSYNILPIWAVEWAARILPWFEFLLGVSLLAGIGLRWAGLMASGMLLIFIFAMTRAYMNGLEIMCGCFGNNEKLGPLTLLRDSTMLIPALGVTIGAFLIKKRKATLSS